VTSTPRARPVAAAVALVSLAVLTWLSILSVLPPSARAADAPADEFSAARAFLHVEHVGARTHVAGSPANDAVRAYLVATLRGLGLQPEVQEAVGATTEETGPIGMARVRNVVALLPGSASTGRLFLVAHYDSVQVGPGASDDGAGVSTLLETARAMTAGAKPRNDVVFVFTDAEEACLCGAEAFAGQHRLAADGGVVLNLEARGSGGPAIMFETSAGNSRLVDVYGAEAPHPVGTSFAVEVYRILPNDTDFSAFLDKGRFTGLNAAYIDGSAVYHTPYDTPSNMDRRSLQHHGDNALALGRAFSSADLRDLATPAGGDATYFPALNLLVRYPGWLVWPFAMLALVAVGVLALLARRSGLVSWPRVAAGFGLGLIPLILAPVAAQLLWLLLVAVRPGYSDMIDPWRPGWFRLAVVSLVGAVLLTWYGLLRRRIGRWALWIGALGWLAVLGIVLAAFTPGGSYLAALPALAAAIAGLVAVAAPRPLVGLVTWTVAAAVAVIILAPTVLLFFPALGLATGGAAALFAVMLGLALLPVLDWLFADLDRAGTADVGEAGPPRRWLSATPAVVAAMLAVACVGTGLVVDRFDGAHPVPAQLMYALDVDTGQARWVTTESAPGAWTSRYVNSPEQLDEAFPILSDGLTTGPAQAAQMPAPALTVVSDSATGGQRTLTLAVRPQRAVRMVYVRVDGPYVRATVAGREIPAERMPDAGAFEVLFHAPPPGGLQITLVLARTGPARIRVIDGSDGLDGLPGFEPRPRGVGVTGSHSSDLVLVAKTYTI